MRSETRDKLIGSGGFLAVGLAGLAADKLLGLDDQMSHYVSTTGAATAALGGIGTIYYGVKAGLESCFDRYRDSTPEQRRQIDRERHN